MTAVQVRWYDGYIQLERRKIIQYLCIFIFLNSFFVNNFLSKFLFFYFFLFFFTNYLPLAILLETYHESGRELGSGVTCAKLKGIHNTLTSYKFLASLGLYEKTLRQTAHLAYVLQGPTNTIVDIKNEMKGSLYELTLLFENDDGDDDSADNTFNYCLPFPSEKTTEDKLVIK